MKPTEELTRLGILRRRRPLAMQALAQYPIAIRRVDLVSHQTNYIYRVLSADGTRHVLRLVAPFWRTEENLQAEVMWLDALARDTSIPSPRIIPTTSGQPFVRLSPGHGRPDRRAVLMTWLPGMLLSRRLLPDNIRKMGELFGNLHVHAQAWQVPTDFPRPTFESFLSRGEEDALASPASLRQCQPREVKVLQLARQRVESAYSALDRNDLCVIHCDLWHDNIKIFRGELAPFDFEDTVWGYRLHDIAMALLDLAEDVGVRRYQELYKEFRRGYESILPFPEGDLVGLQIGRLLWVVNWYARFAKEHFPRAAAFKIDVLRRALSAGALVDPLSD